MMNPDEQEGFIWETKNQITRHEAVCEERYKQIEKRLGRLETIMIGTFAGIIIILVNLVTKL